MTGRPPFLPIYSHEADIWKGYNFSMEDIRKGYLLLKVVYIRVRDWTSIDFLQLLVFRATFWKISEQFLLLVFFQFWDIWVAFSAWLNWPCFHIAQCFSRQFMNFLWKRSRVLTPWGADDRRKIQPGRPGLIGQMVFWTKFKMVDVDSHLTDTSVWGEKGHSTILMAHNRIFTRIILILMCSIYSYIFWF